MDLSLRGTKNGARVFLDERLPCRTASSPSNGDVEQRLCSRGHLEPREHIPEVSLLEACRGHDRDRGDGREREREGSRRAGK